MKLIIKYVSLLFFISVCRMNGQTADPSPQESYQLGAEVYSIKDLRKAEAFLKSSIRKDPNPKSLFELAKICTAENTISGRSEAREYLRKAIFKDPKNLDYRFLLAELMEKISSGLAYDVYKKILEVDSTSSRALFNLGRIKEQDFDDYHNSVFKEGNEPALSYEKFAQEDLLAAENYLSKAIKYDSLNKEAYLHLSFLYEDDGESTKGIPLLNHLIELSPSDENAHLYLGLLYYETSQMDKSYKEFQKALSLMSDSAAEDFTYNSVKELLKPALGGKFKEFSENDLRRIINYFWKINDPLYITDYNERLLEHYSRVAYANLRYSVPKKNIPGWKTDRGEIVLRYGEPIKKIRFRPHINAGGRTEVNMKTDVWYYKNFTLGFTDQFFTGNFIFSEPEPGSRYIPQFIGDTPMLVDYLRKDYFQGYTPKFDGPSFEVPYSIKQFRSDKYNYTDVYVDYGLDAADSLLKAGKYFLSYEWGLFYFDTVYNPIVQKKGEVSEIDANKKINIKGGEDLLINSLEMTVYPDSGNLAFEIERKIDNGVSSNHLKFSPTKFKINDLDISDIILASNLKHDTLHELPLNRNGISLLPNPTGIFTFAKPIYIYYELYNLKLDKNGYTNLEQKLVLKKRDEASGLGKAVNSVLNVVGLGKQKEEVIIMTKYQTKGKDPQMNFQFDMHNYKPGDYVLTLIITDELSGKEVSKDVFVTLR